TPQKRPGPSPTPGPQSVPHQVGRTDQTRLVAQRGRHHPGLRTVATTGEMTRKGPASRVQEKMSRLRHTSTDDEQLRVEGRREVGQALAEPFPCVLHELHASAVTLVRQLTHQGPGDQAHVPTHGLVEG